MLWSIRMVEKSTEKQNQLSGKKQAKARDKNGRFVKGTSGNPNGRPKNDEVAALLYPLVPKAVKRIEEILDSPDATCREILRAAELVLDRVYGKAFQAVQVEAADTTVRIIDTDPEGAEFNA